MSPPRTLENKIAIVTGASRGIGVTLAYDLASRGAKVAITYASDSSTPAVEALQKRIATETSSTSIAIQADLTQASSAEKIINETVKAFGHIDILVNNAAVLITKFVQDVTLEDFASVYNLNVRAPLLLVQKALPHLRRPGRIINMSSVGARANYAGIGLYSSSKAALEGLTRTWSAELGGDGTTVNAVNPSGVESDMLAQVDKKTVDMQKARTSIQNRVGTPQEIAEIVAFLAEERSSWVTGQCISASGGYAVY